MRVRSAMAATTLACLTLLWSAPAALAADGDDGGSGPTATAPPDPGGGSGGDSGSGNGPARSGNDGGAGDRPGRGPGQQPPVTTTEGPKPVPVTPSRPAPPTGNPSGPAEKPGRGGPGPVIPGGPDRPGRPGPDQPGPGGPNRPGGPDGGDVHASLSVSPKVVRQGDAVFANGDCRASREESLRGDGVSFRGARGWVDDNARLGDHTVTRVCVNGPRRDVATDHLRVVPGGRPGGDRPGGAGPWDLWLSDRSGYRGDEIDVSVRCRDDRARLDGDGLDDITLRRDGSRLTGATRVLDRADPGWHRITVSCDGNRVSTGFWVLRDRPDHDRFLDLDPAFGHPGDAIDVRVGCDARIGSLDSRVLDDIDLDHDGRPWRYRGTTHVADDAAPGEHSVQVRCGDDTLEVDFFVQADGDDSGDDGAAPGGGNDVTVYPKGAPETGGGPVAPLPAGVAALGLTGIVGSGRDGESGTTRRKERS